MKKSFIPPSILTVLFASTLSFSACQENVQPPVDVNTPVMTSLNKIHTMFYDEKTSDAAIVEELQKEKDPITALRNVLPATSKKFVKQGMIDSFDMVASYKTKHAILYYIPRSVITVNATETYRTLVFLHGGGSSTATYQSAKDVAQMYMGDFLSFAENTKTILVFPSSSIGWNAPTRFFMRELLVEMRKDLPLDPNRILISGHSMGAMGLTREGNYLADLFNGIEPLAGGTKESYARKDWIKAYFNVPYTHINGKHDHFSEFHPWMVAVQKKMNDLETELGMKSKFTYFQHGGDHNYDLPVTLREYEKLFSAERDLYQKRIFGSVYYLNKNYPDNGYDLRNQKVSRYFWIEVAAISNPPADGAGNLASFDAEIRDNVITITTTVNDSGLKTLNLNLTKQMVDMTKPVKAIWDNAVVFEGMVEPSLAKTVEIARRNKDSSYLFDASVQITR